MPSLNGARSRVSRWVPGLESVHLLEHESGSWVRTVGGDGVQYVGDVIAERSPLDDGSDEPPPAAVEDGSASVVPHPTST